MRRSNNDLLVSQIEPERLTWIPFNG